MSNSKTASALELLTYSLKGSRTHEEIWGSDFPFPRLFNDRGRNEKCEIFVYRMDFKV